MIAKRRFYQNIRVSWISNSYMCAKYFGKKLYEKFDMYRIGFFYKSIPKIMEIYIHAYTITVYYI